jgi:hypothetical protein
MPYKLMPRLKSAAGVAAPELRGSATTASAHVLRARKRRRVRFMGKTLPFRISRVPRNAILPE